MPMHEGADERRKEIMLPTETFPDVTAGFRAAVIAAAKTYGIGFEVRFETPQMRVFGIRNRDRQRGFLVKPGKPLNTVKFWVSYPGDFPRARFVAQFRFPGSERDVIDEFNRHFDVPDQNNASSTLKLICEDEAWYGSASIIPE